MVSPADGRNKNENRCEKSASAGDFSALDAAIADTSRVELLTEFYDQLSKIAVILNRGQANEKANNCNHFNANRSTSTGGRRNAEMDSTER